MLKTLFNNSHFLFLLFFTLSVIKPVHIPNINRYIGMGLFVLISLIFIINLFKKIQDQRLYQHLWQTHRWLILAISLFLAINVLSLLLNLHRFPTTSSLIFYGFASFAVWLIFPMGWVIFRYNTQQYSAIGWAVMGALVVMALWQIIDKPSSQIITHYFVASDAHYVINSLTRWHTIYGAIAAVITVFSLQRLLSPINQSHKLFFLILAILAIYTGVLGESRNFMFTLGIGILLFFIQFARRQPKISLLAFLLVIISSHWLVINNAHVANDYGRALPYLLKLNQKQNIEPKDFIPQWNNNSLSNRLNIWQRGINTWQQNRWIGIGAGAFRASSNQAYFNLHNYYLQVLVDVGILGLSSFLLLLILLLRQAYKTGHIVIFITILSSLIFDNYLDYSMAWVLVMVWMMSEQKHYSQQIL